MNWLKDMCLADGCMRHRSHAMGDWVNFCPEHWFQLPAAMRLRMFESYSVIAAVPISEAGHVTIIEAIEYLRSQPKPKR